VVGALTWKLLLIQPAVSQSVLIYNFKLEVLNVSRDSAMQRLSTTATIDHHNQRFLRTCIPFTSLKIILIRFSPLICYCLSPFRN
jgi:hypothetical protein